MNRLCESVAIEVICELPEIHRSNAVNCGKAKSWLCPDSTADAQGIIPVPPEMNADHNYVVLAKLEINGDGEVTVDHSQRRRVLPLWLTSEYLQCGCTEDTNGNNNDDPDDDEQPVVNDDPKFPDIDEGILNPPFGDSPVNPTDPYGPYGPYGPYANSRTRDR